MKEQFPFFKNNKDIIFLDSAASSQIHKNVLEKINYVYENNYSNIHRGLYKNSEITSNMYEKTKENLAKFINAEKDEIIWTKGTTEGLNLLANHFFNKLKKNDVVLLTKMEHHANLVPWQKLLKKGIKIEFINVIDGILDFDDFKDKISKLNVKVISICHASNVTGVINPINDIISISKHYNAETIIDAAQTFSHLNIDVKNLDCDYMVFSSHKAYGPNSLGCLFVKKNKIKDLTLYQVGGDTVETVSYRETLFLEPPQCFEAGTPNISGVIAFNEAIDFLSKNIENNYYLLKPLISFLEDNDFTIISKDSDRVPILSFYHKKINNFDLAYYLSLKNVCCRIGEHCAMPFIKENLNINGTIRFSLGIYNDYEDINKSVEILKKFIKRGL